MSAGRFTAAAEAASKWNARTGETRGAIDKIRALHRAGLVKEALDTLGAIHADKLDLELVNINAELLENFGDTAASMGVLFRGYGNVPQGNQNSKSEIGQYLTKKLAEKGVLWAADLLASNALDHSAFSPGEWMLLEFQSGKLPNLQSVREKLNSGNQASNPSDAISILHVCIKLGLYQEAMNCWERWGDAWCKDNYTNVLDYFRLLARGSLWQPFAQGLAALSNRLGDRDRFADSLRRIILAALADLQSSEDIVLFRLDLANICLIDKPQDLVLRVSYFDPIFKLSEEQLRPTREETFTRLLATDISSLLSRYFNSDNLNVQPETDNCFAEDGCNQPSNHTLSRLIVEKVVSYRFMKDFISWKSFEATQCPSWFNIIRYWDSDTVPAGVSALLERSRKVNQKIKETVFSDSTARYLIHSLAPEVLSFWERCPKAAFRADIFRIIFLYEFGGIWVDADEEASNPLCNLEASLSKNVIVSCLEEYFGGYYINNDFIVAPPKHPLLARLLARMTESVKALESTDSTKINYYHHFGPALWSREVNAFLSETQRDDSASVVLFSRSSKEYFFRTVHVDYKNDASKNWRA